MSLSRPTSHMTTVASLPKARADTASRTLPPPESPADAKRRTAPHVLLGVAAGLAVAALRYNGILQGPLVVLVVLACIAFAPGPRRLSVRSLVAFALAFGWLPLLGWIPSFGTVVDVPGLTLALLVAITCSFQIRNWRSRSQRLTSIDASEGIGLALGTVAALWWALPFSRLPLARQLAFLMRGWDNSTHFQMFRSNLRLGSFITAQRTAPGGGLRLDWDYPQGMHQAFAQLVRLWSIHPPLNNDAWLLHAYTTMLFVTAGFTIVSLSMCIARVSNGRALVAVPGMAIVLALFAFGPFQLLNGYPNFDLGVAAAAVGIVSVLPPRQPPRLQFVLAAGMLLVDVYAWYPLALFVVPAAAAATIRLWRSSRSPARWVVLTVIVAIASASAVPALGFAHRGVRTLSLAGGGIQAAWGRLVIILAALALLLCYRHLRGAERTSGLVLASPVLLGGPAMILLIAYELVTQRNVIGQHVVGYYGQKFGLGLLGVALLVLTCLTAHILGGRLPLARLSSVARSALVAIAFVGLLQIFGYVGPLAQSLQGLETSPGLTFHDQLSRSSLFEPQAAQLLAVTRELRARHSISLTDAYSQRWFVDPAPHGFNPDTNFALFAIWFDVLASPDPTIAHNLPIIAITPKLELYKPPDAVAKDVISTFPLTRYPKLQLFVPTWLLHAIEGAAPTWSRAGALIPIPGTQQ